jgi:hypothetical protein
MKVSGAYKIQVACEICMEINMKRYSQLSPVFSPVKGLKAKRVENTGILNQRS